MVSAYDCMEHLRTLPPSQHRRTLVRVMLNALYDPHLYPVGLCEVLSLPSTERVVALGFLQWCHAHPACHTENEAEDMELWRGQAEDCS